jgi:hypothetical protein
VTCRDYKEFKQIHFFLLHPKEYATSTPSWTPSCTQSCLRGSGVRSWISRGTWYLSSAVQWRTAWIPSLELSENTLSQRQLGDCILYLRPEIRESNSGIEHSRSRHEQRLFQTQERWRSNGRTTNITPNVYARTHSDGQGPYVEFQCQRFPRTYSEGTHVELQHELYA